MKPTVDARVRDLIDRFGTHEVLAALCRECNRRGMPVLFRKLNRVYEWLAHP